MKKEVEYITGNNHILKAMSIGKGQVIALINDQVIDTGIVVIYSSYVFTIGENGPVIAKMVSI